MSEAAPNISKATWLLRQFSDASVRGTADLAESLGITTKSVSDTAAVLVRRGYLVRNKPGEYQLSLHGREALDSNRVITSGPNGPLKSTRKHRNSFRARAWRAMRVRRVFTMADLISDAEDGNGRHESNLSRYLGVLKQAGYVVELARRTPGSATTSNGYKRFRLVRDTGPIAPVHVAKTEVLHDFNLEEGVPCKV
ncbi:hypothetical protein [Puniceibacterium sp. IMCC21224]|uniref:hypothetical protein n=1 Tax=Puniceibacterium sp. IMCC21224 TaxID=1618204 RepID=UPI00065DABF7|nr:hypothetical protein [Puniceibacterium sp. IMCC21224]KMK68557.1 hypothetical protein IMCC21224_113440 [Puniceibacterium sp. IMCC21224]